MTETEEFVLRLEALKEGERSALRRLAGRPLDATLSGFDLFTGLWWPLRERSQRAPRREASWLAAKVHACFRIPHVRGDGSTAGPSLACLVGASEPPGEREQMRFRQRFDALLEAPLSSLEPHLSWALSVAADAVAQGRAKGLDWVRLLEDLSIWDRGQEHRARQDLREVWAEEYLRAADKR